MRQLVEFCLKLCGNRRQGPESENEYSVPCIDMRANEVLISAM